MAIMLITVIIAIEILLIKVIAAIEVIVMIPVTRLRHLVAAPVLVLAPDLTRLNMAPSTGVVVMVIN